MTVHVDVIKEESYTIEIDVPENKEDELYNELPMNHAWKIF